VGTGTTGLRSLTSSLLAAAFCLTSICAASAGGQLEAVKSAGELACGVVREDYDYSKEQTHGNLSALGTDICKAVAAAVLGENAKLKVSSFPDEQHGLEALRAGKLAVLAGATPRVTMGAIYGVAFSQPFFFDGQGFMTPKTAGIKTLADLTDKQVCFIGNTEAESVLDAVLRGRGINFRPFSFEEQGEMEAALFTGHCAAMTGDLSQLANSRAAFHARNFVILPEIVTLDPLAAAFRDGDPQWAAIVNWTMYALIQAEASGVTRANVDAMSTSEDLTVNRWLTKAGGLGRALGLDDDWAVHVIKAVGNYGEMFDRDVGKNSPLQFERGMNALWTEGGMIYPLPGR